MDRREVVKLVALAGTSFVLPGCLNGQDTRKMPNIFEAAKNVSNKNIVEIFTSQFKNDYGMPQAKDIFYDFQNNNTRSLVFPVEELQNSWGIVKNELSNKKKLFPKDALKISAILIPALRMLYQAETGEVFLPHNQTQAYIPRLSTPSFIEMSRRNFFKSPKIIFATSKTTMPVPTRQTIYPGQCMSFEQKGYCLDPGIPAPRNGEQFALRPVNEALPEELQPVYRGVLNASRYNEEVKDNLQDIVWALRTATDPEESRADRLDDKKLSLLNKAYPGAKDDFLRFRADQKNKPNKNILADIFKIKINGVSKSAINDMSSSDLINMLENAPVKGEIKKDTGYSMLAPGVAANTKGTGKLKFKTDIVNTSSIPFDFDPIDYMAESEREVQKVAIIPVEPQDITFSNIPVSKGELTPGQYETLTEQLVPDMVDFVNEKEFEGFYLSNHIPGTKDNVALNVALQGAKIGADITPGLGNVLSAYEAWHGRDWLTGEKLGTGERIWATVGTIPGANMLKGAVGIVKAKKVVDWAGNTAMKNAGKKWDDFVKIREGRKVKAGDAIYEWVDSEAWEMTKEEVEQSPYNEIVANILNSDMSDAPQDIRRILKPHQSFV